MVPFVKEKVVGYSKTFCDNEMGIQMCNIREVAQVFALHKFVREIDFGVEPNVLFHKWSTDNPPNLKPSPIGTRFEQLSGKVRN